MATVTGNPLDKKVEMANTEKVRKPSLRSVWKKFHLMFRLCSVSWLGITKHVEISRRQKSNG
jgi:hypothetical protein